MNVALRWPMTPDESDGIRPAATTRGTVEGSELAIDLVNALRMARKATDALHSGEPGNQRVSLRTPQRKFRNPTTIVQLARR